MSSPLVAACYKRRRALSRLTLLAFCMSGLPVRAREKLKVAVLDIPPFGFLHNGHGTGIFVDLATALGTAMDADIEADIVPLNRIVSDISHGYADFTTLLNHPAITAVATSLGVVCDLDVIVWPRKDVTINSLKDLQDKKILFIRGAVYEGELNQSGMTRLETSSPDSQVKMLKVGRVEAVAGVREALMFAAERQAIAATEFGTPFQIGTQQARLFVSRQFLTREASVHAMTQALYNIKSGGEVQRIIAKYLLPR